MAGGFVIAVADTVKGVRIEVTRSEVGIGGVASAVTNHMVRDSAGVYTYTVAQAPVAATSVPCPPN